MSAKASSRHEVAETPLEVSFSGANYLLGWPEVSESLSLVCVSYRLNRQRFDLPDLGDATFLTVFEFDEEGPVHLNWIKRTVAEYCELDDVFQPDFLKAVLFCHTCEGELSITNEAAAFLREQGATIITTSQALSNERKICPGPYYYLGGGLRSVWKLYEDTHDAFLQATILDRRG